MKITPQQVKAAKEAAGLVGLRSLLREAARINAQPILRDNGLRVFPPGEKPAWPLPERFIAGSHIRPCDHEDMSCPPGTCEDLYQREDMGR